MSISADEFKRLAPNLSQARRDAILPGLQAAMTRFGITTKQREVHFFAQCGHESGGFFYKRELASGRAYEGRRDLGNTQPGDGPRFRGRGFIQLTGRANYRTFGAKIGVNIEQNPELAETDANAALLACAYWDSRRLNALADRDDFLGITRAINGGTNGLADRRARLSVARVVLSEADPDPSEDDDEIAVALALRGVLLPITGHLQDGTTWAALRPLAGALGLVIQSVGADQAMLGLADSPHAAPVRLQIDGGRGYSPVREIAGVAGLGVRLVNGRVEIA